MTRCVSDLMPPRRFGGRIRSRRLCTGTSAPACSLSLSNEWSLSACRRLRSEPLGLGAGISMERGGAPRTAEAMAQAAQQATLRQRLEDLFRAFGIEQLVVGQP